MNEFGWRPVFRRVTLLLVALLLLPAGLGKNAHAEVLVEVEAETGEELELGVLPPSLKRDCLVFVHLQKAGGTTVKKILFKNYPKHIVYDTEQWKEGEMATSNYAYNLTKRHMWDVAVGGYTEALRPSTGRTCEWFTVFRHPIPRLVSAYFYCKKASNDQLCASAVVKAADISLVDFAKHWGNFGLRQLVLSMIDTDEVLKFVSDRGLEMDDKEMRRISGWYLVKRFLEHKGQLIGGNESTVLFKMLQNVRDNIHENFDVVGILENFSTTLDLLNHRLSFPDFDWKARFGQSGIRNKDSTFAKQEEIALRNAWTSSEIKSHIDLDLLLYEHAVDVFREQAKQSGLMD